MVRRVALLLLLATAASLFAVTQQLKEAPPIHPIRWYNSRSMTLSELRGRVVLIGFWSTRSNASVEAHRDVARLADDFKAEKFSVILYHSRITNVGHVRDVAAEKVLPYFLAENRIKLPVAIAGERDFAEYGVIGLPRFVLVDKRGMLRYSLGKPPSAAEIRQLLAE
jgi:hypothetical protein